MSLTKQIILAIVATITLALFGVGSYYASRQIFPDPTTASGATPTATVDPKVITVEQVKQIEPKTIVTRTEGDFVIVQFETAAKVGATLYVTTNKKDNVPQSMTDFKNGVSVTGKWVVATANATPSMSHVAKIPKSALAKSGQTYYYILLSYKSSWLRYGATMDYSTGPTEPYVLKVN